MPYRNDGARVQDGEGAHRALHGQSHASATSTRTARELRPPPSLMLPPMVCVTRLLSVCSRWRNYVVLSRLGLGLRSAEQRSWPHRRWRAALAAGRGAPDACCWRSGGGGGGRGGAVLLWCGPPVRGRHWTTMLALASSACGWDGRSVSLRVGRQPRSRSAWAARRCGVAGGWPRAGSPPWNRTRRLRRTQTACRGTDRGAGAGMSRLWTWSLVKCRCCVAVELGPRCRHPPTAAGMSSAFRTTCGHRGTVDVSVGMPCRRRGTRDGATAGATTRRRTGDGGTLEADAPC